MSTTQQIFQLFYTKKIFEKQNYILDYVSQILNFVCYFVLLLAISNKQILFTGVLIC